MNGGDSERAHCPRCRSEKVWRDGLRDNTNKVIQRFICRNCGYRFSGSNRSLVFSGSSEIEISCQVCDGESKNLIVVPENGTTGEISKKEKQLENYVFYLKKRGNKFVTIERRQRYLKELVKIGACLEDQESVKKALSEISWVGRSKNNAALAYTLYLKMEDKTWEKPKYQETRKIPFVPTELEIDQLIAGSSPKTALLLQTMKETAMRPGEAINLTWNDIDPVSKTITVTPEKGSNPRIFEISDKLLGMFNSVKGTNYIKDPNRIFQKHLRHIRRSFQRSKIRLAEKLQNQRIKKIMLKTLRTWKATMEYHQTRDPYYVMDFLGHTSLQHTRLYVQLDKALFKDQKNDMICKIAKTEEEAKELIELGFTFSNQIGQSYLYWKRK